MKNLNNYANTIGMLFELIADAMDDTPAYNPLNRLHELLDADTCAEIISAAKEQQEE
jgi:hypothetical protein